MNVSLYIARRYFSSKKKRNAVNIITGISVIAVAVGTMGLIIVLSVFNGFGNLVLNLYNDFDADLKISAVRGKFFNPDSVFIAQIEAHPQIQHCTQVLEENVLLRYRERQFLGRIKAVSDDYILEQRLKDYIIDGDYPIQGENSFAIMGSGVAYALGLAIQDPIHRVNLYMPRAGAVSSIDPSAAFTQSSLIISSVFAVQQDFDSKYIIIPLKDGRALLDGRQVLSSLELDIKNGADLVNVQQQLQQLLGTEYKIEDRTQQHSFLHTILKTEKFAVFLILAFILLIATFNIIGSLTLLILDKKKDIVLLKSLGAGFPLVRKIFFWEGMFISLSGLCVGLTLGLIICLLQMQFGLIRLDNANAYLVEYYPVQVQGSDFLAVFMLVFAIGFIASYLISGKLVSREYKQRLRVE